MQIETDLFGPPGTGDGDTGVGATGCGGSSHARSSRRRDLGFLVEVVGLPATKCGTEGTSQALAQDPMALRRNGTLVRERGLDRCGWSWQAWRP